MKALFAAIKIWTPILFLGALSLGAYVETRLNPSYPMAALAIAPLAGMLVLYAIEVLGWRIGGKLVVLEKKVQSLEQADTELKTLATALVKSLYALEAGGKSWKGNSDANYALIRQYLDPVKHLLDGDLQEQAAQDVAKIKEPKK